MIWQFYHLEVAGALHLIYFMMKCFSRDYFWQFCNEIINPGL